MSNNPNITPDGIVRNRNWRPRPSAAETKKMQAEEKRKLKEAEEREARRLNEPSMIDAFISAISKVKGLIANKDSKNIAAQKKNSNTR